MKFYFNYQISLSIALRRHADTGEVNLASQIFFEELFFNFTYHIPKRMRGIL